MSRINRLLAAALWCAGAAWAEDGKPGLAALSAEAWQLAGWVKYSSDNRAQPFAIIDKKGARIYVFEADGRLLGASNALLGQTIGDDSAPGIGERTQTGDIAPDERTTPAGRFESKPGRNLQGEPVVWVDWDSAFAIHRLRPGSTYVKRKAALATAALSDKRQSLGCVVVPVAFYETVVQPVLGNRRAVVYVLPETRSLQATFGAL